MSKDKVTEKHPSLLEAALEMAKGLHEAKVIDNITMKKFEQMCIIKTQTLNINKDKS